MAGWAGPVHRAGLSGIDIITAGIVLLILLPAFRVALMLIAFLRDRDYRFAVIAALVLIIIFAGFVLGLRTAGTAGSYSLLRSEARRVGKEWVRKGRSRVYQCH